MIEEINKATFTKNNYNEQIEQIRHTNATNTFNEEDQYDLETRHSIITEKQEEWSKKINKQLKEMKCY